MKKEEIAKLVNLRSDELVEACRDPKTFWIVASYLVNLGIQLGKAEANLAYNQLFRGHNETTIGN